MSKYEPLWVQIGQRQEASCLLTFGEIEAIAGIPVDHSFLSYKKELLTYGWHVEKISLKQQTVLFRRNEEPREGSGS